MSHGIASRLSRVASALATPLVPEDYLGLIDPMLSSGRSGSGLRARVEAVTPEAGGAVTLTLRPGAGWAGHRAGQWVRLGVQVDGVWQHRSYSLTSPPRPDGLITVTVARHEHGKVSRHLGAAVRRGDVLRLEPAQGDFVLPTRAGGQPSLLFVAGGSGITPLLGLLRQLDAAGFAADVVLVHSARTPEEALFSVELRSLARRHPGFRLVERHTATAGRLTVADLEREVPDWRDREAFACGPAGLLGLVEEHHGGVVHTERFAPVQTATGASGSVVLARSGKAGPAEGSLLDGAEAAGALMPSGCRMGICFGCVVPLKQGRVKDLRTGCESGEPGDLIQTCINSPIGEVVLDA